MNEICFYHANCVDGLFSAYAHFLGTSSKTLYIPIFLNKPYIYESILETILATDFLDLSRIFFVDCIGPEDLCIKISNLFSFAKVIILDHHKTSMNYLSQVKLPENLEVIFDMERSGAKICYDYFNLKNEYPELEKIYNYVQDYDLWQFIYPESKAFTEGIYENRFTYLIQEDAENCFKKLSKTNWNIILEKGNKKLEEIKKIVSKNIEKTKVIKILKFKCLAILIDQNDSNAVNDLANEMALKSLSLNLDPIGIVFKYQSFDEVRAYVRSTKDFDSSEISLYFGGGGHSSASGFVFTKEDFNHIY